MAHKRTSGFTIVELLIVIVVIGILAAIIIAVYNGIQTRAQTTAVKSDLTNAAKQMELAKVDSGSYPTQFPPDTRASSGDGMSLAQTGDANTFCINGQRTNNADIRWHYESGSGLQSGSCSGAIIPLSEYGMPKNLVTDTTFATLSWQNGWHMNMQNGAGTALSVRPGTSSDPYPNSPVLVLTNTTSKTTSWAVLENSEIALDQIKAGKTYQRTVYVRDPGYGFDGDVLLFGVMDETGQNTALDEEWKKSIGDSWTKLEGLTTAHQDAISSNQLYMDLAPSEFTKTGWTLEFQGFDLHQTN